MLSARRQFLDAFLGALGAAEIVESLERATEVRGTLRFAEDAEVIDLSGDEGGDLQDFVWRVREEEAPALLTYRLADVLHRYQLVEVDRLRVSPETLLSIVRRDFDEAVGEGEFAEALAALFAIAVAMVEEGVETGDVFCLRG